MATVAHSEPRRHYSWWWNSHISPKNSKWLQENLTDMDMKVKSMIKLIEEDADSFARRAEMYYKKRPELMKMVEEFYRAYRALAERYDHATGALRQAHRTMEEAFPNQIPLVLSDDSPHGSSTSDVEPHTPEMSVSPPVRALFDSDELQKDAIGFLSDIHVIRRNGAHLEEINSSTKKGLKQLTGMSAIGDGTAHTVTEARMRKGLNFQEEEEEEAFDIKSKKGSREAQHAMLKQERSNILENLQQDNARLLTENQNLKGQVLEESDRAVKAESEVQILKDAFSKMNLEKDANNLHYQTSLEKISVLESQLSNTQSYLTKLNVDFINEVQKLKSAEKLNQSSKLELDMLEERAKMQEAEIQSLKDALSKLNSEKDADYLQYQTSLQKISVLETQLSIAESDLKKLYDELENKVQKLGISEQLNQSLELELDKLEKIAKIKEVGIKEKHYELDKLQVSLNEKRRQYAQAEAALHSHEKLLVTCQEEICNLKEKNSMLNEENRQFTLSIKKLNDEIVLLKDQKDKLEYEVGKCVREKETLNQEVLQLKDDRIDLERIYQNLMEQMNATITSSESLQADIKELTERSKEHEAERMWLLEKLKYMDGISEKNVVLKSSLTNANIELEMLRGKLLALDDSRKSLSSEKESLVSHVQTLTLEVEKLSEKNISAENSLSNANTNIEHLSMKLNVFGESCKLLESKNSTLVSERNNLLTKVEKINLDLGNITSSFRELQDQHSTLSSKLNLSTNQAKELQNLLGLEKQQHLHLTSTINNLQDEIIFLKDQKIQLEDKVRLFIREVEILNQENAQLKEDKNHLEKRQQDLTEQLNAVNIASKLLQEHVKDLEQECDEYKAEKVLFQEKLRYMNSVSEENSILEKSIDDANSELESLKEKLEFLKSEKGILVSQVQILTHDKEFFLESNAFMEKSLSGMSSEIECLSGKLKHFEESCQLLSHCNSVLVAERDNLNAQVESMTLDIKDTRSSLAELQEQNSSLSREWDLSTNQIKELQFIIELEKQETVRYISMIQDLQDEIILLKDNQTKLGEEVGLHVREKEILSENFTQLKEDKNDLDRRHIDIVEQKRTISLTLESREEEIQDLKERCKEHEAEKMLLMEKLGIMDSISEENVFLKNSLRDANEELDVLREKLAALNDSHEFLICKKDSLVCQVQTLSYNKEKLSEKNTSLDNSLTEIKKEVDRLRKKLKHFQESCQILNHHNSVLNAERNSLVSEVQRINLDLRIMTTEFAELQDQHSSLARDWDLSSNQVKESQALLELKKLDDVLFTSVIEDLHNEIILLNDQKIKLEDEVELNVREKEILNQELFQSEEDRSVLQRRHQDLLEKNTVLENTLADASAEIKVLTEKFAALDDSHQSLNLEKDILVSQVQVLTDNIEKLSEVRTFLENSLSEVNSEVERLSTKMKGFEDSCQFLNDQNSVLTAEKNSLVSHVEKITLEMENITSRFTELQDQHLSLTREWDLSTNQIEDLQCMLEMGKKAHQTTIVSYKAQLTNLENQIYQLQNQNQLNQKELAAQQINLFDDMIETFILKATLSDVQERNLILSSEGQKHLEAYSSSEALVSQLEQEKLIHLGKIMSLTESNRKISNKVRHLSSIISSDQELRFMDENQDSVLDFIMTKINKLLTSASEVEFDSQQLHLELSIFITLVGHIAADLANMGLENISLQKKVEIKNGEILSLRQQQLELLMLNEKIMKNVDACNQREQALKAEAKVLCMLSDEFQGALQKSKSEIIKLLEGNKTLFEELCTLKQKHKEMEEEHVDVLLEAMKLDHLHLLFKNVSSERLLELMSFNNELNSIYSIKDDLQNEVYKLNEKICLLEAEKMQLMESVIYLQEELRICLVYMEFDSNIARIIFEDIDLELKYTKNKLMCKDTQLSEANLMVLSTQASIVELHRLLESLYKENKEAKLMEDEMRKKVTNLSELVAQRNDAISNLCEANEMLQKGTDKMQKDLDVLTTKEKSWRSELEKERTSCEFEFVALLSEHQISAVQAAIFKEKLHELLLERETLSTVQKQLMKTEVDSTKTRTDHLKKKLGDLAEEHKEAKVDMDTYLPLVKSLWTCIASLETQIMSMPNVKLKSANEGEIVSSGSGPHHSIGEPGESHEGFKNPGVLELEKLIAKAESLHEVLISTRKLLYQERYDSSSNLEVKSKEIEESNMEVLPQEKQANKKSPTLLGKDEGMDDSAISQGKYGQAMKDIPLDQLSSSVLYRDENTYQMPEIGDAEIDDKLWEAAETESKSHMRKTSSVFIEHDIQTIEVERSEYPSSELVAEKELSIDKVEISSRELTSEQTWNVKITKKLESNAQRLSSLKISIDESKSKMENSEMRKLPASFGYDPIKTQLNEAEVAVLELININRDLAKKTEEYSSLDVTDVESKERCSTGRRQMLEQAKRGSEKVGRLELELQKIQYILMKMEEELESRRSKAAERKTRVLLRDYLYGRKGKMRCCGCVTPKTDGD